MYEMLTGRLPFRGEYEAAMTYAIVNEAPDTYNFHQVKTEMKQTYNCEVVAVLPHVDKMSAMAYKDIFALHYPQHNLTTALRNAAISLTQ